MNPATHLQDCSSELLDAARSFQTAAQVPASHTAVPESLAALEDTLQALSAAWYQLAAHVSSRPCVDGLSREREARLIGTLHDVAAAFARCARECRDARSAVTPIVAQRAAAAQARKQPDEADVAWFESRERPTQRVA
jgi:hypothetical protein